MNSVILYVVILLAVCGNFGDAAISFNPQQQSVAGNTGIETRLAALEGKMTALENNLVQLQTTINLSSAFWKNQQLQLDVLTEMIRRQKAWLIDVKSSTMASRFATDQTGGRETTSTNVVPTKSSVAFTASLDHDMSDFGADQTVIFNKVILNEGSAYNEHTGVFTCPTNGLYDFSFVIGQRDKNGVWAKLVVNSDVIVAAGVDAEHQWQDIQGGNRALLRLNEGDVVRVVLHTGGTHVEGDTQPFTTFSGVLLSK